VTVARRTGDVDVLLLLQDEVEAAAEEGVVVHDEHPEGLPAVLIGSLTHRRQISFDGSPR